LARGPSRHERVRPSPLSAALPRREAPNSFCGSNLARSAIWLGYRLQPEAVNPLLSFATRRDRVRKEFYAARPRQSARPYNNPRSKASLRRFRVARAAVVGLREASHFMPCGQPPAPRLAPAA
jgi:hypothetical protein